MGLAQRLICTRKVAANNQGNCSYCNLWNLSGIVSGLGFATTIVFSIISMANATLLPFWASLISGGIAMVSYVAMANSYYGGFRASVRRNICMFITLALLICAPHVHSAHGFIQGDGVKWSNGLGLIGGLMEIGGIVISVPLFMVPPSKCEEGTAAHDILEFNDAGLWAGDVNAQPIDTMYPSKTDANRKKEEDRTQDAIDKVEEAEAAEALKKVEKFENEAGNAEVERKHLTPMADGKEIQPNNKFANEALQIDNSGVPEKN